MSTYYFDSSAWVKVYVPETGTPWVTNIFGTKTPSGQPLHRIAVVNIGIVEVAAAIARRERMGQIRPEKRQQLYKRVWFDNNIRLLPLGISNDIIHSAAVLTQSASLHGYDAIHLAAALTLNQQLKTARLPALTFVSADTDLCSAATAEGLTTDNPNNHP
ncbi:MAG: hypothetical protein AUK02_05145 [Anaerolineae bacterium CG2_30_58_95]|nr:MAG: hypothetical protein AUK02_05145 [Anaerolineae bacterium CG2_30_58_95]